MKKIKRLTPDQEEELSRCREEWFQWGVCTEPADRLKAETAISTMYRRFRKQPPRTFVWCRSPATALINLQCLKHSVRSDDLKAPLWGSFYRSRGEVTGGLLGQSLLSRHRGRLCDGLWEGVRNKLWDPLRESLETDLRKSIWDGLRDLVQGRLRYAFWDSLVHSLPTSLRDGFETSLREQWYGQHDSYWIASDLFCRDVMGVTYETRESEDLDLWRDIAQSSGWWWPYKDFCVIAERPILVRMQKWSVNRHRLHCENGPALAFSDGWEVYALNGVRVPPNIVNTSAAKLDPHLLLQERSVEIRREIARKIGVERIMTELMTEILDERNGYQLLVPDFQDGRRRPYLIMLNPSEAIWHIEGVHPDCRTVLEALAWRNNDNLETEILT